MLSREEEVIVRRLVEVCQVPKKFAELVVDCETIRDGSIAEKIEAYKLKVEFLDKVVNSSNETTTNDAMEFGAQCLASRDDVPIQLARIVVSNESGENIEDEHLIKIRGDRLNFLLKVFSFVQNNPRLL